MNNSDDFRKLMKLIHNDKFHINSLNIELKQSNTHKGQYYEDSIIELKKGDEILTFKSSESDVASYVFSLQQIPDKKGEIEFKSHKDLNKYFTDIRDFLDEGNIKLSKALEEIVQGKFKFSYAPESFVKDYLGTDNKSASKYSPLQKDYYYILAYYNILTRNILEQKESRERVDPNFQIYYKQVEEILRLSFLNIKKPLKGYIKFSNNVNLHLGELLNSYVIQASYIKDVVSMLSMQGDIEIEKALNYLLDFNRRYLEIMTHFINVLRIGIEIIDGVETPKSELSFNDNYEIIKAHPKYNIIVKNMHPSIRHAESHSGTRIDKKRQKVIFLEFRGKKTEISQEFTFKEILTMSNYIKSMSYTILLTFILHETLMIDLVLRSPDFMMLLLGIDNSR